MGRHPAATLKANALRRRCDAAALGLDSTKDLDPLTEPLGQRRALEALAVGLGIKGEGYNMFALGPVTTAKRELVRGVLEHHAATLEVPDDWCYVDDFERPFEPHAIRLPAGVGAQLRDDLRTLVAELEAAVPAALESEEFRSRTQIIEDRVKKERDAAVELVSKEAEERGLALLDTPVAFVFAPIVDGEVIEPQDFEKLPKEDQERITTDVAEFEEQLETVLRRAPELGREVRQELRELGQEMTRFAIDHLLEAVNAKYEEYPAVLQHLAAMKTRVIDNVDEFLPVPESGIRLGARREARAHLRRYHVNLLVDRRGQEGGPIIFEENPSYSNLMGRIDQVSDGGTLITDLEFMTAGALHRANGGYLVLEADALLRRPYAWEALKQALRARELRIESVGEALSLVSTVSLRPTPIPLDLKVVLLGSRSIYHLLSALDPEFDRSFKVAADFDDKLERTSENERLFARSLAGLVDTCKIRHLDRGAIALVIEHSSRLAGDADRLSTKFLEIEDLLQEANYFAAQSQAPIITRSHVQEAIDSQVRRLDRIRERAHEQILRETVFIDTQGEVVGQVNALSVIQLGRASFGIPSRITVRVRMGKGDVVNIEREVDLSGPIHTKGVMILSSLLAARFGVQVPLSLSASIVFEQNYGGVDGDSASSTEMYGLLSAIAQLPLKQSIAVTGSVDQHGRIQPIGGVNEKIEGFFDICNARGLTGDQGVMIPAANIKHLMLRQDVIDAVSMGMFRVIPVEHIDQGIEVLTGYPSGQPDESGNYAANTVGALVEARVRDFARRRASFGKHTDEGHTYDGPHD